MPRRWRRSSCAGSRSRAIRSTSRCLPRSPSAYAPPLATGENLFSTQDVENLVRFGGLTPEPATSSRSIRRRPTASRNMRARSAMLERHGWPRARAVPARRQPDVARHRRPASASAARNPIPACSATSAASPTMRGIENGISALSDRPGIGFEGQAALYRIMRDLAGLPDAQENLPFVEIARQQRDQHQAGDIGEQRAGALGHVRVEKLHDLAAKHALGNRLEADHAVDHVKQNRVGADPDKRAETLLNPHTSTS